MMNLKPLNKKAIKEILKKIKKQFSTDSFSLDHIFYMSSDKKIFIISKKIAEVDLSVFNINNIGLYFGTIENDGFRLSIEGSQIIAKLAKKNILEINRSDLLKWYQGENILLNSLYKNEYVILKYKNDILGCGKIKNNSILNYVDKGRRIKSPNAYYLEI